MSTLRYVTELEYKRMTNVLMHQDDGIGEGPCKHAVCVRVVRYTTLSKSSGIRLTKKQAATFPVTALRTVYRTEWMLPNAVAVRYPPDEYPRDDYDSVLCLDCIMEASE